MMRINKKYAHITSCYHRWVYVYCLVCLRYLRLSVSSFGRGDSRMMVAFWCHQKSSINDFNLRFLNSSRWRSSGSLLLKEHLYFSRHTRTFIALSFFSLPPPRLLIWGVCHFNLQACQKTISLFFFFSYQCHFFCLLMKVGMVKQR